MPDITPVVVILDGQPVSSINPLPTSGGGGGGGGIVEQGKQGSIASPWFVQPTADGATVSLPLPTGAATDAKQDTGNASLASIDGKVATAANQTSGNAALPTGAATAAKQPALGTAGTPSRSRNSRRRARTSVSPFRCPSPQSTHSAGCRLF